MKPYINLLGVSIPSYGLMIVIGVLLANIIAWYLVKRYHQDFNDFMVLEAYTFLGGFIGAKLLYLLVSFKEIEWNRLLEFAYFNQLMQGGFVFFGGLIGGLIFVFFAGKFHKIKVMDYLNKYIILIPFIHAFGRLGCFLAGCCYGQPYNGWCAVKFPEKSMGLSGISLFPIQLVEAMALMLIFMILLFLNIKVSWKYTIETYFLLYGCLRFILEYYRYDDIRGHFYSFSTSQWISIILVILVFGRFVVLFCKSGGKSS